MDGQKNETEWMNSSGNTARNWVRFRVTVMYDQQPRIPTSVKERYMLLRAVDPCTAKILSAARNFEHRTGLKFILYHSPNLSPLEASLFHRACGEEMELLEKKFHCHFRRYPFIRSRLGIYLLETNEEVGALYGRSVVGLANWKHWYITISAQSDWREILRHELAHILGGQWNPQPPRILEEGLAVWAQGTIGGYPPDHFVWESRYNSKTALAALLAREPKKNPARQNLYYALAGSFSGFLIRQFGWDLYRKFYGDRRVTLSSFPDRFAKTFRIALAATIPDWLRDLRPLPICQTALLRNC